MENRHRRVGAVDGTRRRVQQMSDFVVPAAFGTVQHADDIALYVRVGIFYRVTHAGQSSGRDFRLWQQITIPKTGSNMGWVV